MVLSYRHLLESPLVTQSSVTASLINLNKYLPLPPNHNQNASRPDVSPPPQKSAIKLRTKHELKAAACKCRPNIATEEQQGNKDHPAAACLGCAAGRKAKLNNRLSRSAGDLLHEIDGALVLSKGFLFARGMVYQCVHVCLCVVLLASVFPVCIVCDSMLCVVYATNLCGLDMNRL